MDAAESSGQATPIADIEPWPSQNALEPLSAKIIDGTHYLWTINSFTALNAKETSVEFKCGGTGW